ncbi:MAG: YhbY family RNA-binding protein [Phycisphaerae bacterium]|nr:YhbY family RNA-binding protein [Phycisphaerae bacterium]
MSMTNAERQSLKARANALKSTIFIGREGLTPAILDMIRIALQKTDLIKVRIRAEDAESANELARSAAQAVPCELVALRGRVAILHRIATD